MFRVWSWSFFSKCAIIYADCKNGIKSVGSVSSFWDNGVWICCRNISKLWREYMWSAVNVLPKRPKVSDLNKRNVSLLNFSWLNGKLGWKSCRADFNSVRHPSTGCLSKVVLKQKVLGIQVTTFRGVNNFRDI